jgi:hypothetical protein
MVSSYGTATITTPTSNTSGVTGVAAGTSNTAMDHYKWNFVLHQVTLF